MQTRDSIPWPTYRAKDRYTVLKNKNYIHTKPKNPKRAMKGTWTWTFHKKYLNVLIRHRHDNRDGPPWASILFGRLSALRMPWIMSMTETLVRRRSPVFYNEQPINWILRFGMENPEIEPETGSKKIQTPEDKTKFKKNTKDCYFQPESL